MQSRKALPGEIDAIEKVEKWIEEQRLTMLTEVNLGNWSGLTTRAMAEEAGCTEFYNYVYSPFSACVHSMWHHIAKYNAISCKNPLHGYHRVPDVVALEPNVHYFYLAAKYAQKSLAAFDKAFPVQIESESAFEKFCEALE